MEAAKKDNEDEFVILTSFYNNFLLIISIFLKIACIKKIIAPGGIKRNLHRLFLEKNYNAVQLQWS